MSCKPISRLYHSGLFKAQQGVGAAVLLEYDLRQPCRCYSQQASIVEYIDFGYTSNVMVVSIILTAPGRLL